MAMGQRVAEARPSGMVVRSAMAPIAQGMAMPPKLPDAASIPNIEAPPRGKRSAVVASMLGHKQLTANPIATHAPNAAGRHGAKLATR